MQNAADGLHGLDPAAVRSILHVDMDAFYVAVETLLDPSLRGKPVIVGGDGARGVVASCNYEARAFGVRSAMPSVRAKRLCPKAIFLRGNHALYGQYSERIHEVFASFTPAIEPIALDEAFLDLTHAHRLFGTGAEAAVAIRERVREQTGLPCSVGVATSKLLAKLASKLAKPPIGGAQVARYPGAVWIGLGVLEVVPGHELTFLHPLSVQSLWGVGPKTFERLARFGIATIGDLAALPEATLVRSLGDAQGRHLHALAMGVDSRPVVTERAVKSIGHEETFSKDQYDAALLDVELLRMTDAVASRLRANGVRGRTVQLKLKTSDFRTFSRSRTLPQPIDSARPMYVVARELLHAADVLELVEQAGCRLLGVSMANLSTANLSTDNLSTESIREVELAPALVTQLGLFDLSDGNGGVEPVQRNSEHGSTQETETDVVIAATVDAIRARFGTRAVGSAALAGPRRLRVKVAGDTQWGPTAEAGLVDPDLR